MPNGGYPMHYLIHIPNSDLAIHCDGATVHIKQVAETGELAQGESARGYKTIGNLTNEQICGLIYHLNYWGIDTTNGQISDSTAAFNSVGIRPQYRSAGCEYD
jgi:hypothetical protein